MGEVRRTIRVVDNDGNPIADALIAIEASDVPFPEISLISDTDGRVGVSFQAGHYRIGARTIDGDYGLVDVEINNEELSTELTITVYAKGTANGDLAHET